MRAVKFLELLRRVFVQNDSLTAGKGRVAVHIVFYVASLPSVKKIGCIIPKDSFRRRCYLNDKKH
jgi:hypothetical protein